MRFFKLSKHELLSLLKRSWLAGLSGFIAGVAATLFLILLEYATTYRGSHQSIVWFLPLVGWLIATLFHRCGKDILPGNNLVLDEIHDPKQTIPARMAPLILIGTVITHLFGGSAGREGTAVQMGASLSDQLAHLFRLRPEDRTWLLQAGAGAGFGAAIGTPWAGMIFGMEVIYSGKFAWTAWLECMIASFVAYFTSLKLHAPHSLYPEAELVGFELKTILLVAVAGVLFGVAAKLFIVFEHWLEWLLDKFIQKPTLKPLVGGLILVLCYQWEGTYRFAGLGIEHIQHALQFQSDFDMPVLKTFFTSLTLASGFKGGEFIPMVFIGTTLGSALAPVFSLPCGFLGAVGFGAVFGAAANTPVACTVMVSELFGLSIGPYALVACFTAFAVSGQQSIYKAQRTMFNNKKP